MKKNILAKSYEACAARLEVEDQHDAGSECREIADPETFSKTEILPRHLLFVRLIWILIQY